VTSIINAWDGGNAIESEVVDAYVRALSNPEPPHAVYEEYRTGDTVEIEHDRQDRNEGRRIRCPVRLL